MVNGALANTLVTRPLREIGRCSTIAESGMNASLNSELRDCVERMPITFQSSLNSKPGVLRGSMKQVRMMVPWRLFPCGLEEKHIRRDALGAENLAPVDDPSAFGTAREGA